MLLIDTNVWLELLLDQEKADQVRNLFHFEPFSVLTNPTPIFCQVIE